MIKYPKTPRLSKLVGCQEMFDWQSLTAVVEEKVDGANAAVSFEDGKLVLQSRGHVLTGGDSGALVGHLPDTWRHEPDLIMRGLYRIAELNLPD